MKLDPSASGKQENFQLFKAIVDRIPWGTALRGKGVEQSWQIFREVFNRVPEGNNP